MNHSPVAERHPRVLHVTSALDPGGIETWLGRLLSTPEGRPLIGAVLVLSPNEGLLAPRFRAHGVPVHCLPAAGNPARFVLDLARALRRTGPWDVVHSHVYRRSALVHLASVLARIPLRVTHSHTARGQQTSSRNPLCGILATLATMWINAVSHLRIACSRSAAISLFREKALEDARLLCMPCGMDIDAFLRCAEAPISRASLGIPDGATVIGHVGRFMPEKNHEFLLRTAAEAIRRSPRLHFLLIGDGPLRGDMESLAASLGINEKVSFTGNRLDVPSLMRHAMDYFFLPSRCEGLGIVALEAQALGLPCLLSDVIPPEANRLPLRNRTFPLGESPAAVATALLELLDSATPRKDTRQDPHRFLYSISDNARSLSKAYDQALSERPQPRIRQAPARSLTTRLANEKEAAPWK
ncbi:MAG: glycosyltransferase [Bryobacterales bacterium]|nr:glycosyltransferase [Bryobacterales bacterium]